MTDFSRFESRYRIQGLIELLTPMRIGSQQSSDVANVNIPVIKDGRGRPIIPGSSMKGVLRAYADAVLRGFRYQYQPESNALVREPLTEEAYLKHINEHVKIADVPQAEIDENITENHTSLLERVFGSMWFAAKFSIREAYPIGNARILKREGVSINRDRRTANDKGLYDFEMVGAGATFSFEAYAENPTDAEFGLILLALRALEQADLSIGGGTSRGLGAVRLNELQIGKIGLADIFEYTMNGTMQPVTSDEQNRCLETLFQYVQGGNQ